MNVRRRRGATLGLIAACVLVILVIGAGVFFLIKIMGGGREIANATDAGTLNVAKAIIRKATVPDPYVEFQDCEYPMGCGYINLLTYNRCVAKAIMIAGNAYAMSNNGSGPGSYTSNANNVLNDLDKLGDALSAQIASSNGYFDQVSTVNSVRMASLFSVLNSGACQTAWMKKAGPTNIFFNNASVTASMNGVTIPISASPLGPQNASNYVSGASGGYMAGYVPISVMGHTVYGVPVFPQQNPHLVSLTDFNAASAKFGHAPPDAVQLGGHTTEMKTNMLTGAIACAIVGSPVLGTAGAGGTPVGQGLLGSGFQFPAASSYGYIEFGNYPANNKPPGYDPADYSGNIFNNELYTGVWAAGDSSGGNTQSSTNTAFGTDPTTVANWLSWAKNGGTPPYPTGAGQVFVGPIGTDLRQVAGSIPAIGISSANPPTSAQINLLKTIAGKELTPEDCTAQLDTPPPAGKQGLQGSCLASMGSMEATFKHPVPALTPATGSQNFSQADWAKADLLTDFEGRNPTSADGKYNNWAMVDLTGGAPASGLGILANVVGKVPNPPPNTPTPLYPMPLERPGTIYQLMQAVQPAGCLAKTVADITQRCQQIQPNTSAGAVMTLLNTQMFPMAPAGPAPSWTSAAKLYIYLANGDLSTPLIISSAPPPKLTNNAPDGCCSAPDTSHPCYLNQYDIVNTLVDSHSDQMVHDQPYTQNDGGGGSSLQVIDHADWQPGSGADNNFGRMTFQEIGIGTENFWCIN